VKSLAPFRVPDEGKNVAEEEPADFATTVLRRAKKPRRSERSITEYVGLLQTIPPTSNHCERFFSRCKYVLTPHRSSMAPANFEMLMFLKANRDLWGAATLIA
jgi:hypothetical protein